MSTNNKYHNLYWKIDRYKSVPPTVKLTLTYIDLLSKTSPIYDLIKHHLNYVILASYVIEKQFDSGYVKNTINGVWNRANKEEPVEPDLKDKWIEKAVLMLPEGMLETLLNKL